METSGTGVYVVVPCYNEEGAVLRGVVTSLLAAGHEVVLVDDGSREPALSAVSGLPVHCLRHAVNLGQGAALQTGISYCRRLNARAVIHFDADGQHEVADIPKLLSALSGGADVALGSRFLPGSGATGLPRGRRVLLRVARLVNGVLTGLWLTDAHNGLRALNARALERIDLHENRMAHATEILEQMRRAGLRVVEVPVTVRYTAYSRGKGQRWSGAVTILLDWLMNRLMR